LAQTFAQEVAASSDRHPVAGVDRNAGGAALGWPFMHGARVQHCQSPSKGTTSGLLGFRPSPPNRPFSGEATIRADITKPSLYDRLGGIYAIASVVDDFIDRIMIDPALNANPTIDDAHHRVGKAGFKYLVTEMFGWAIGGPQKYTGRSMRDSHGDLKITNSEWMAFCKDLQDTLDRFKVQATEQQELFAIVQSTKADIVSVAG
jgi:hemoglobin